MNISEASERSGLPSKTLRYYEDIGLVKPGRYANGYRNYSPEQITDLIFVRRVRQFGFSIHDCEQLLDLLRNPQRKSHDVHDMATKKLAEMDAHLAELAEMRQQLSSLIETCANDAQAECAIINSLAEGENNE